MTKFIETAAAKSFIAIEGFGEGAPYEMFAAVTTQDEYEVTFHETLEDAQEAAVERVRGDAYYVEGGEIRMYQDRGPDYSCDAGRVSEMLLSEINAMATSDIAGLAGVVKRWSDAFQAALKVAA